MRFNRRQILQAGGLGTISLITGCCYNPALPREHTAKVSPGWLPLYPLDVDQLRMIDAHGHFFNATDMQAGGYLRNAVIPDRVGVDTNNDLKGLWDELEKSIDSLARLLGPTTSAEWRYLDSLQEKAFGPVPLDGQQVISQLDADIKEETRRIAEGVVDGLGGENGVFANHFNNLTQPVTMRGAELRFTEDALIELINTEGSSEFLIDRSASPEQVRLLGKAIGAVRFLFRMLSRRCSNIRAYHRAFTDTENNPGRSLQAVHVVDALVDFDYWMGPKAHPCSRLQDQIILHERLNQITGGYLLPLVGFNPWSASKGGTIEYVDMVENAIKSRGFRGIKLYPPNGFSAAGSVVDKSKINGRSPPLASEVRETLYAVYEICMEYGAVVMAHGNFSSGLDEDFKALAGPSHWRELLCNSECSESDFRNLRVNIGHFGGGPYGPSPGWSREFLDLMERAPNLYSDLGYHDELLKPGAGLELRKLLKSSSGDMTGLGRVMFGTDWLMLELVNDWDQYADILHSELGSGEAALTPEELDALFYQNAANLYSLRN